MALLDIFKSSAFSTQELTDAINIVPNQYGKVGDLNLFPGKGVRTRSVMVEYGNGSISILPAMPVGSPGSVGKVGKRQMKSFAIPHFPHDDIVLAEEVQGIRAFGSENTLKAVQDLVNEKLATMKKKHDQTLEWLRLGALKGLVQDGLGNTLLDIYSDFGISQTVQAFSLSSNADVRGTCMLVKRAIEVALLGSTMDHVQALVAPTFYDALTSNASVKDAYKYFTTTQPLSGDYRKNFLFGGIEWIEYNGQVPDANGTLQKMIADNTAIFYPVGSTDIFRTYFAPADFIEAVNTEGMPVYAKQEIMKFERGIEIHTQSNPLPIVLKPATVVKGTA